MKLGLSVATNNRFFGKAMRRIRPALDPLLNGFDEAVPSRSSCDAILVGLTDEKPADYFNEVENSDGFFQVVIGCPYPIADADLTNAVYDRLLRAITACPMTYEQSSAALVFTKKMNPRANQ